MLCSGLLQTVHVLSNFFKSAPNCTNTRRTLTVSSDPSYALSHGTQAFSSVTRARALSFVLHSKDMRATAKLLRGGGRTGISTFLLPMRGGVRMGVLMAPNPFLWMHIRVPTAIHQVLSRPTGNPPSTEPQARRKHARVRACPARKHKARVPAEPSRRCVATRAHGAQRPASAREWQAARRRPCTRCLCDGKRPPKRAPCMSQHMMARQAHGTLGHRLCVCHAATCAWPTRQPASNAQPSPAFCLHCITRAHFKG